MTKRLSVFVYTLTLCALTTFFVGKSLADNAFTPDQTKALEKIIRDTIVNNPEIVRDALIELEKKQVEIQEKQQVESISKNSKAIFHAEEGLIAGNPKGDVTVVEFFDYNCGFCRRAMPHILKLIDNDKNVKVVFKELPIFGEKSEGAARAAIAAKKQGKYMELHRALFEKPGNNDVAKALRLAKVIGLDVAKLKEDMKDPSVQKEIDETKRLANELGIQGTPFYLVGDKTIPGAPDNLYDLFVENVEDIRKNGCTAQC